MARFGLLPTPLPGHVNPTLAVARELVGRGHEVVYHLPEPFRDTIELSGASLNPLRVPPPAPRNGASSDPLVRLALAPVAMTRASLSVLPQIVDLLRADPPDVLAYDALSVWGRIAAELLPSRAAMLWASYAMNRDFSYFLPGAPDATAGRLLSEAIDGFAADMDVLAATYGTRRLNLPDLFLHNEPLTIVFAPRQFQPAAATFGHRYLFVGPSLRAREDELDSELAEFSSAPMVYVSLGTVFNDWPEFYPLCAEAFAGSRLRALISGLRDATAASRANLLIRPRVAQLAVLRRTEVFVTHGGMNSTMEALAAAVPMVIIPQMPEQALTAERVAQAGAGLVLPRAELTPATLNRAVEQLAADPSYRTRARRLWASLADSGGAPQAAAALSGYADGAAAAASSM